MHSYRRITFIIAILTSVLISACTSEPEQPATLSADQLDGRWELFSAMRNGESTQSLEGTYIEFEGGKMTTNFTGEAVQTDIQLEEQKLKQNDQVYTITSFNKDTLAVTTSLMNFDFRLHFTKIESQ